MLTALDSELAQFGFGQFAYRNRIVQGSMERKEKRGIPVCPRRPDRHMSTCTEKKTATHRIYNLDSSFLQSTIHYSVKQTKTVRVGAQVTSRVTYAEPRVGTADESGV